jgi:hypothetical protein
MAHRSRQPTPNSTVCALISASYYLGRLVMLQVALNLKHSETTDSCNLHIWLTLYFLLLVTMQAQTEAPPDMQCKDKFLVQSVAAEHGATTQDINAAMVDTQTFLCGVIFHLPAFVSLLIILPYGAHSCAHGDSSIRSLGGL